MYLILRYVTFDIMQYPGARKMGEKILSSNCALAHM